MNVHEITPEITKNRPLEALRSITYENPKALANELEKLGFKAVPQMGEPLFQYIYDYLIKNNGNKALIVGAFNRVPMLTPPPASRRSSQTRTKL